jgi:hypothetical protein
MDRVGLGFLLAGAYNTLILVVSRGLSNDIGVLDPLFSPDGCVGVLLWGVAYAAMYDRYATAPAISAVFAAEKAFYAGHWALWLAANAATLVPLAGADPLTAVFLAGYGLVDAAFMVFFGWVAWTHRSAAGGLGGAAAS